MNGNKATKRLASLIEEYERLKDSEDADAFLFEDLEVSQDGEQEIYTLGSLDTLTLLRDEHGEIALAEYATKDGTERAEATDEQIATLEMHLIYQGI